jgi:CheY-like chemotaxis protein
MSVARHGVLVIEDNRADARLTKELLAEIRSSGQRFETQFAPTLEAGLQRLTETDVAVVLLDLGLPDSEGLEGLTRLRAAARHLPVVVLTGADDERLGHRAVREGAQDYLVKWQFDSELLGRSLGYAIDRHRLIVELERSRAELHGIRVLEERERIAMDLHGGVIRALYGVGLALQGSAALVDDERLKSRLAESVVGIDNVISDLRNCIFGIRYGHPRTESAGPGVS